MDNFLAVAFTNCSGGPEVCQKQTHEITTKSWW